MRLTFYTDMGQNYTIEVDPQMELENITALLEAESGIAAADQSISYEGRELSDPKSTMASFGIGDEAVLMLRRRVVVAGRPAEQDSEMMRLQLLGDAALMRQLRETQPDLADAAQNNPQRFGQLLAETRKRQIETEQARQREIATLNADPYDIEAQKKIEEAIRMEAVMENLEHAMEFSPEAFGRVHMLYIPVEVNGHPVKAFVDSGAQQTIMNPSCAEACGIMRLLDVRFSGIAKGVGTAKILGRVHSAQMKLADVYLPCAFTIIEGRDVDLLLGLDMLKAHQACIDLEKNVLRIRGREVPFLPEHEIPKSELHEAEELQDAQPSAGPSNPTGGSATHFPGSGNTLGTAPTTQPRPASTVPASSSTHPESKIETLMGLGVTRAEAIRTLDAANGNVDVAASLLF